MKRALLIKTILILTALASCEQAAKQSNNKTGGQGTISSAPTIKPILVDYKSDTYQISLGENYKDSEKIIDWRWAALADEDNKIDSTGKDAFMFLGEPLIMYNGGEWLPSLHIKTQKNIITSFTCAVLFDLADTTNAETTFLRILSKDIRQLQNNDLIQALISEGVYEVRTQNAIEVFRLSKGQQYEYDRFEYTVTPG